MQVLSQVLELFCCYLLSHNKRPYYIVLSRNIVACFCIDDICLESSPLIYHCYHYISNMCSPSFYARLDRTIGSDWGDCLLKILPINQISLIQAIGGGILREDSRPYNAFMSVSRGGKRGICVFHYKENTKYKRKKRLEKK